MPSNTPDQQITLPVGADLADNPLAFTDMVADVETRLVLKYTNVADRTARHTAPVEGDLTGLAAENRYDSFNGTNYVSLTARIDHGFVRRTVDGVVGNGAVNNSAVFVGDPALLVGVDSGGTYMFESFLYYDASATADMKFTMAGPAASAAIFSALGLATTTAGNEGDVRIQVQSFGTSIPLGAIGVGTFVTARLEGFITTTAAGNIQVQFAQQVAEANQATIRNGSYLRVWRMS